MKDFLFEIKTRIGKNFFKTLWGLLVLYVKIIFKKDFIDNKNNEIIDVVIPTTDRDLEILAITIESLKNCGNKINNVYIVAPNKESIVDFCKSKNITFIDELNVLGFGKDSLKKYTLTGPDRRGWLFQQFLKYGIKDFVQQENYLVLDSDTVFINTNTFIENNNFIFFNNTEWNKPYFLTFEKIFGYKAINYTSFTSHAMIFNRRYLNEMIQEIEMKHSKKWYNVIQEKINRNEMSTVSDYENYGQWMNIKHRNKIIKKPLYNKALNREKLDTLGNLEKKYKDNHKSLSFHHWINK